VLDADALTVCAREPGRLRGRDGLDLIITPHPGEMARLSGRSTADVQKSRLEVARDFATTHDLHVVLKGHRTLVASPDGRVQINRTGNPGMATGGTGDVLTGVIAAWLAQLLDPDAATRVGVYLHGKAGDLAAAATGGPALIASDILRHLGAAWQAVAAEDTDAEGD
jgi:NAD(P)H-hydrate epimerase